MQGLKMLRTNVKVIDKAETMVALRDALRTSKEDQEAFGSGWHKACVDHKHQVNPADRFAIRQIEKAKKTARWMGCLLIYMAIVAAAALLALAIEVLA